MTSITLMTDEVTTAGGEEAEQRHAALARFQKLVHQPGAATAGGDADTACPAEKRTTS